MKSFAVYDSTGNILRVGFCVEGDISLQAGPGEFSMECGPDVRDDTHKVTIQEGAHKIQELNERIEELESATDHDEVGVTEPAGEDAPTGVASDA